MSNVNVNLTLENVRTITVMLLDIFIMWAVIYYSLRIVRSNSRTTQIFKGIILVLIIDVVAKFTGLKTVAYFTDIFVNWGFLAAIIIFQPELRSLLERLGKSNVFSRITTLTGNQKENLVDQIVTATMLLSQDQTGALISIEQSHSLEDFVSTGTRLNSDVTAELLTSLFVTSTPLHDGAVIIQGDKIACASAYFPPTNLELPSRYGARHRAAIGISEITDAVTIVVSEETGAISITEGGKIFTVNRKQLRDYLLRVICGEETEVRNMKKPAYDEPAREVIISDEKEERKKDKSATSVINLLAIKKQAEAHDKIEVEQITPAADDEKIRELEEEASDIKLPHKKSRPTPSYPKNAAGQHFEDEKRALREAEELKKNEEQKRLEEEAERIRQAEQERIAREEAERKEAAAREEALKKAEEERLLIEEQERQRKAEEEQREKEEQERKERAARAMRERLESQAKAKQESAHMTSEEVAKAREAAKQQLSGITTKDEKQFDTTKIDISSLMGMDGDLDKAFDLIDSIDSSSTKDDTKGGE